MTKIFVILFVLLQLKESVKSSSMELEVRAEFDNDSGTIEELQLLENTLTHLISGFNGAKTSDHKNTEEEKKKNIQRMDDLKTEKDTLLQTFTTKTSGAPPTAGKRPFSNFIAKLMKHFAKATDKETHSYAIVLQKLLTNSFMADHGMYMLGSTFVTFTLNVVNYATKIEPHQLREQLRNIYHLVASRDRKFNSDTNSVFNFIDGQYDANDTDFMERIIKDLTKPGTRKKHVIEECINVLIANPIYRLPPFERDKLAFRIGSLINKSSFYNMFLKQGERSGGPRTQPMIYELNVQKLVKNLIGILK